MDGYFNVRSRFLIPPNSHPEKLRFLVERELADSFE